MTLIISVHAPSFVMLIGDQRLSADGGPVSETSNKLMAIAAMDSRLALGYTGLASTDDGRFVTQDWLRLAICGAGDEDPTYFGITKGLAARLTHEFKTNTSIVGTPPGKRRLTALVAGYVNRGGIPVAALSIISNYQDFDANTHYPEPWDDFRGKMLIEKTPSAPSDVMVQRIGAWPALRESRAMRIEDAVRAGKSAKVVATIAAGFIREAAGEAEGGTIGHQANAVIIERKLESIESWFSSGSPTDSAVFPDMVTARLGASVWARFELFKRVNEHPEQPPAWIPTLGRSKPCSWGSGKPFKHCHGKRRRGSS